MANRELVGGVGTYFIYGIESTYGTAAGTVDQLFGLIQSVKTTSNNELVKIGAFAGSSGGGREAAQFIPGKFSSTVSVEFRPVAWDWLVDVFGSRTGSGTGASPYSYTKDNTLSGLTLAHNFDNVTTDREVLHLGSIANTITIRASIGEPVVVSIDFISGDLDKDTSLTANVALPTGDAYTFAGGSIELPNGSALPNIIDSVEITITNNAEVLYGLGSRFGQQSILKELDYQVKYTLKYVDETVLDLFLGSATGPTNPTANATMAIKFTNGANKLIDFVFTTTKLGEFATSDEINQAVTEDITALPFNCVIGEQQTA